jgi:hypothetical protein
MARPGFRREGTWFCGVLRLLWPLSATWYGMVLLLGFSSSIERGSEQSDGICPT